MVLAFVMVDDFVYQLSFVGKNLFFEMHGFVEILVHLKKYLVDSSRHHLVTNN